MAAILVEEPFLEGVKVLAFTEEANMFSEKVAATLVGRPLLKGSRREPRV